MVEKHYIIRGGQDGRERLRLLSRVMRPTTRSLLERVAIRPGMACLDCGCGGGDVSCDLAEIVGSQGRVVGIDIDSVKLDSAREDALARQLHHVEFRLANLSE